MDRLPQLKPSILVVFGITGDLAKRKILPAIYQLVKENMLPEGTRILGISRRDVPIEEILDTVNLCANEADGICDPAVMERIRACTSMFRLDPLSDQDYESLKQQLNEIEQEHRECMDRMFYLSIPPQVYAPIIQKLGSHGLSKGCSHGKAVAKLMIEKPFGYDVKSAEQLIEETEQVFSEEQIYRIDHYLAKETAQNILKFRRHNPLFSAQWDGAHLRRIHVIAKEKIGIENRVNFYERVGAMRDLIQSHLMQLLALSAMEMPEQLNSDEVHAAKHKFLDSLLPPDSSEGLDKAVVRGQYDTYKEEVANPGSATETFVSLVLRSSDPAWKDCEFQLTTGKALDEKVTIIKLYFGDEDPNVLSFRIQPDEGIDIDLLIEEPGFAHRLSKVKMNFSYAQSFDSSHDAYERVLIDAIRGDKLLFATKAEVMASWRLLQPVLDHWVKTSADLLIYPSGSKGPSTERLGRQFSAKLKATE